MNVWLKLIILNCKVQCHQMIMADKYMGFEEIQVLFQKQLCYTFNSFAL